MKTKQKYILKSDKQLLDTIEILFKSRLKKNKDDFSSLIKNTNFNNNQNYVLGKKIVNHLNLSINVSEN
jgi:hypothetical protein